MAGTIADFIQAEGLTSRVVSRNSNPNMTDPDSQTMDHWCVFVALVVPPSITVREMAIPYSMGSGHNGVEPTLAEVLDCLAMDASGVENARDFADWASEYGYNEDSRKAFQIWEVCQKQAKELKEFLGEDSYKTLLWDTERE